MNMPSQRAAVLPGSRADLIAMAHGDHDASLVEIDDDIITQTPWPVENLQPMTMSLDGAIGTFPPSALAFLLMMTAINYRFWRMEAGEFSRYAFRGETGARALWGAFEAAWGFDEFSPKRFASRLAAEGVESLFGDIPDAASRAAILGEMLRGDLAGHCETLEATINANRAITVADAAAVASAFPMAFGDPYLKKIQLALSMFGAYLRAAGSEIDTRDLTAFADYQVPRVLRALGILRYSDDLAAKVDGGILIACESPEERSIRAATILACERIAAHCKATAADVDNLLWQSQDLAKDARFHLTPTTWY